MKVLLSAYSCRPNEGSEPGVGWNNALQLAQTHDVWVVTRQAYARGIDPWLAASPQARLRVVYYDLPAFMICLKRLGLPDTVYYYLWQLGSTNKLRKLHAEVGFDVAQHVTWVKYLAPSPLAFLPVPYIWGPVGGGERAPEPFMPTFSLRGKLFERLRGVLQYLAEKDPLIKRTARRSQLTLVTTKESLARVKALGAPWVELCPESALNPAELELLASAAPGAGHPVRFISIGRQLHWKGFHLGLNAFAEADLANAEYWLVGDGPEVERLKAQAANLGIADKVTFWGRLSRQETLAKLKAADVLVHPSLHDSGGWVCIEAMAASRPVICLNLGGPATQVTPNTGIVVEAVSLEATLSGLSEAFKRLAGDPSLRSSLGQAGRERAETVFTWAAKAKRFTRYYARLLS